MQCAICGTENPDSAHLCVKCGAPLPVQDKDRVSTGEFKPVDSSAGAAGAVGAGAAEAYAAGAETAFRPGRRTVQLPSQRVESQNAAANTNTQPWEVRVPRRDGNPGTSGPIPPVAGAGSIGPIPVMDSDATGAVPPKHKDGPTPRRPEQQGSGNGKKVAGVVAAALVVGALGFGAYHLATAPAKQYSVSFDTDGGSIIAPLSVDENAELQKPEDPTRNGYTFKGWYLDEEGTQPASFPMKITADTTLYALWTEVPATQPETENKEAEEKTEESASSENSSSSTTGSASANGKTNNSGSSASGSNASGKTSNSGKTSGNGSSAKGSSNSGSGSSSSNSSSSSSSSNRGGGESVSFTAANGRTLSGTVRTDSDGYVIGDSSSHVYSVSELRSLGLTDAELCIAWNEPYARMGYDFANSDLQAYFDSCDWYHNKGYKPTLEVGSAGYLNALRLQSIAKESSSSNAWRYLATY